MVWAVTGKGHRLPLDAEPVAVNGGGGDVLLTDLGPGMTPLATVVRHQGQLFGAGVAYRRHITTCPYGDRYRAAARSPRRRGVS